MNLLLLNAASGSKLEQALEKLVDFGMDAGKDIFVAILIYSVGRFIIKQISVLIAKVLEKRKIETSVQTFLKSLVKILLNMVLAFAIISKLGVETTSFAALLASAGVAVGMALSGNLSNFAGGLIILVFKPFNIDGPGVSGTIKEIQIFHTILSTLDNRMIYVPNGMLSGNAVINYSKQEMRRVEWVFGVEYGEDVQRVRTVLQRIIYADKRILDTPAPIIVLGSLSASSVDITVRVWVKTADYWNVLYDINEIVYTTFNKEGIGFPFPQLTVHQSSK